ncbi:hypothetical protein B0H19DRAFT_963642 [Mycena capillaripes]|nr:hypothetical protein B0H19DRAFT_963642 [Mycena capillaripes]
MPASTPVASGFRPQSFREDTTSGQGFRPYGHTFDQHDYNAYTTQRDLQLLHTPRGRIALQYGGIIARLARSEVSDDDFFRGFDAEIYNVGDCLWDERSQHAYWYDRLSDREIDLLCGVYHVVDIEQTSAVSWWPKPNAWAAGSLDAWWTPQCENDFFQKRLGYFANGVYKPSRQSEWKKNIKFQKEVKHCWDGCEVVADSVVRSLIDVVGSTPSA